MTEFNMGSLRQGPPAGKQEQPKTSQEEIGVLKKELQKQMQKMENDFINRMVKVETFVRETAAVSSSRIDNSSLGMEQVKVYIMEKYKWCKKNKRTQELARLETISSMLGWNTKIDA